MEKVIKFHRYFLILIIFFLGDLSLVAQKQRKQQITSDDYKKWSTLIGQKLNSKGQWASYKLSYPSGIDTVIVQQTIGDKKYTFPSINEYKFSDNGKYWAAISAAQGLGLLNLKTGAVHWMHNVVSFDFLMSGKYIVWLQKNGIEQELHIINLENQNQCYVKDIAEYRFTEDGKIGAYITKTKNEVQLIWTEKNFLQSKIIAQSKNLFKKLIWSKNGYALAFLEELPQDGYQGNNHKLYFLNHLDATLQLQSLDSSTHGTILEGMRIVTPPAKESLEMATDGERVFFYITPSQRESKEKEIVQIWDSKTPWTYPSQRNVNGWQYQSKMAVWWPDEKKILKIGTDEFPKTELLAGERYALSNDPLQYEPQYEILSPVDYTLIDASTGKSKKILEKQIRKIDFIKGSGSGNFINYFKDNHWWIYNIAKDSHTNLTDSLGIPIYEIDYDAAGIAPPYGSPGWSADEKYLIVYDQYDIWLLSSDGKSRKKITRGRENKIRYRIAEDNYRDLQRLGNAVLPGNTFDLFKGLLLEAFGEDKSSGYYYWYPNGNMETLVHEKRKISHLIKAKFSSSYIYTEQTFEISPRLIFKNSKNKAPKFLTQTNPQQNYFEWGHTELISYKNSKGDLLEGILYYPSNFKEGKKYPMIVNIYEKQSHHLHEYFNPEINSAEAFPRMNYVLDGYLLLYPDITYEIGKPGKSATDCVLAAVNAVNAKGIVDQERIGLNGASFGGFETSYIITQTDIFATAVAGCPLTDFVSQYLSLDGNWGRPRMWRYESQQQRMQKSLFENYQGYIDNSPVAHAASINTPLLMWAGLEDSMVSWTQGLELHLALRRLNKPNQFLVYPGENHVLKKEETRIDLRSRINKWFNFYLKEKSFSNKVSNN